MPGPSRGLDWEERAVKLYTPQRLCRVETMSIYLSEASVCLRALPSGTVVETPQNSTSPLTGSWSYQTASPGPLDLLSCSPLSLCLFTSGPLGEKPACG